MPASFEGVPEALLNPRKGTGYGGSMETALGAE
jgi:hypothetical protein